MKIQTTLKGLLVAVLALNPVVAFAAGGVLTLSDQSLASDSGDPVSFSVLDGSDGTFDISTLTTSNPANGTVSVDAGTGEVTYTPNPGFNGADTFVYSVGEQDWGTIRGSQSIITEWVTDPDRFDAGFAIGESYTGDSIVPFGFDGSFFTSPGACTVYEVELSLFAHVGWQGASPDGQSVDVRFSYDSYQDAQTIDSSDGPTYLRATFEGLSLDEVQNIDYGDLAVDFSNFVSNGSGSPYVTFVSEIDGAVEPTNASFTVRITPVESAYIPGCLGVAEATVSIAVTNNDLPDDNTGGHVLGSTTDDADGGVLAASDSGDVLADTGSGVVLSLLVAGALISSAVLVTWLSAGNRDYRIR